MIRVCVVDDHRLVREGIRRVLEANPDMKVTAEAPSGEEALMLSRREKWDVTLLDLSMPGRGGLDCLTQFKADFPKRPLLVLTMHSEDQYAMRAIKAGADGYLTKEAAPELLVEAIRKIVGGGKFISPHLAERLATEVGPTSAKKGHEKLSNREYQVMRMLASGKTVSEIAGDLGLSAKTVSTNRARLLAKMGLRNNAEVIRYALENNLLDRPLRRKL